MQTMSKSFRMGQPSLATIVREIQHLEHERIQSKALDPKTALLRNWQSQRLARTYAEFILDPRYKAAFRFFLQDLYGARDFSQRDHDIQRLYGLVRHIAPEPTIRPLMLSVELHYLTEQLDERLLEVLVNQLSLSDTITVALYAQAYRKCDNYDRRRQQIELIFELGSLMDEIVRMPLSGAMLKLAKTPLERGGWRELMEFMERGYNAFKQMRGARQFLEAVRERELHILDNIYTCKPDPFEFESPRADLPEARIPHPPQGII
jgi:hypothetical protein